MQAAGAQRHDLDRAAGHAGHGQKETSTWVIRARGRFQAPLLITLVLAVPVIVYSEMIRDWFAFHRAPVPGRRPRRAGLEADKAARHDPPSSGSGQTYRGRIALANGGLRCEWNGSRSYRRRPDTGDHHEVGVNLTREWAAHAR